ncbi:MAG TPA: hypothetical protein VLH08_10380 [Acidobacteriota bacterium]|nr:hypothetical protein [Acidobacteriota bacterium]
MMKKISGVCMFLALFISGCADENDRQNAIDVSGTWRSAVTFTSCSPADVCSAAGFDQGTSQNAVMNLSQNDPDETQVEGTYTYEGAGIAANIEGTIGGMQLTVNGAASNPLLGSITVRLTGTVSGNSLNATVTHQINLTDGRSADVSGTGTFTR